MRIKFPAVTKLVFLAALLASFMLVGCPAQPTPTPTPPVNDLTPTPPVDETPTPAPDDLTVYTVEEGDTLSSIAARYSTTVEAILEVNPDIVDPAVIIPGQEIYLPEEAEEPTLYTVEDGDTLESIAIDHDVTVEAIMLANPDIADPGDIVPGQEIWIPASVPEPPIDVTPTPDVDVTPTPTTDVDVTPTPTPDVDVTPTPTPDVDVTPTPTLDVTPTPTLDATPTPDVTPTPTIAPDVAMTIEVVAQDFEFDPDTIQVEAGQRVEFIVSTVDSFHTFSVKESEDATEDIIHIQLCPDALCPGAEPVRFQHVFDEPGEYYLYCRIHEDEGMVGTIIVE
jgi:LysM repeat protein/plastocyanin